MGAVPREEGRRGRRHSARLPGLREKAERVASRPRPLASKWREMKREASRPRPLVSKWEEMKGPPLRVVLLGSP